MKTLFLECNMGASGDMLMSALYELCDDKASFMDKMNSLLQGVKVSAEKSIKCGIVGTCFRVSVNGTEEESLDANENSHEYCHEHSHEHSHKHSHDHRHKHSHEHGLCCKHEHEHSHGASFTKITEIIASLNVSETVKANASAVYSLIAEAEAAAHGKPVADVHFHEVGTLDAVADIVGVCLLIEELNPDKIIASPVNVGSGFVRCAHGILPVPAPATAFILKEIPIYAGMIKGELCTPTGAALLKHFSVEFSGMPVMTVQNTGYGMGKKDFEAANCVRAFLGETGADSGLRDEAVELSCSLDDMTGEEIGYAVGIILGSGALDVWTVPVHMKKNRPGTILSCLCEPEKADFFAELMLRHTTTFGVRKTEHKRYILDRSSDKIETNFGKVGIKRGKGYGVEKSKLEYEDISAIAEKTGKSVTEIKKLI